MVILSWQREMEHFVERYVRLEGYGPWTLTIGRHALRRYEGADENRTHKRAIKERDALRRELMVFVLDIVTRRILWVDNPFKDQGKATWFQPGNPSGNYRGNRGKRKP